MSGYIKGVDVSENNGVINWEKVKASGIAFAMIRAGYGQTVDKQFARNIRECNRTGLPCGVYWFSYAMTAERAAQEAAVCLAHIRPYKLNYPVAYDFEYASVDYASRNGVTVTKTLASDMARAFCRAVRAAGYTAMYYANPDFLNRYFDDGVKTEFPTWLAQWPGGTPPLDKPPKACEIWQYFDEGRVPGISQPVDLDVCYVDYNRKKEDTMTGEQIYSALNEYLDSLSVPEWARNEFEAAKAAGITDGKHPMRLIPRYQAAIMAFRAAETVKQGHQEDLP